MTRFWLAASGHPAGPEHDGFRRVTENFQFQLIFDLIQTRLAGLPGAEIVVKRNCRENQDHRQPDGKQG
jgi:hypothetical protein